MGEPSLVGQVPARGTSRLPAPSPREARETGQGRPTKPQVGAGRREPRPDHNRNRKHSRLRLQRGTGQGRTGGARAHQRPRRRDRLGECATGSKASGPGSERKPGIRSRRSSDDDAGSHPAGQELPPCRVRQMTAGFAHRIGSMIPFVQVFDADVAELADATDLGSVALRGVEVQILSSAQGMIESWGVGVMGRRRLCTA